MKFGELNDDGNYNEKCESVGKRRKRVGGRKEKEREKEGGGKEKKEKGKEEKERKEKRKAYTCDERLRRPSSVQRVRGVVKRVA